MSEPKKIREFGKKGTGATRECFLHSTDDASLRDFLDVNSPVDEVWEFSQTRNGRMRTSEHADAHQSNGLNTRYRILSVLENMINDWVSAYCIEPVKSIALSFGSFKLGIVSKNSDVDAVFLLPRERTSRANFFEDFVPNVLRTNHHVTECVPVLSAAVPLVKICFAGINIDILIACVPIDFLRGLQSSSTTYRVCNYADMYKVNDLKIAQEDKISNSSVTNGILQTIPEDLIYHLTYECMRSLNGVRVADSILSLVPNVSSFLLLLRLVKYWANQRAIYGNAVGFLGGVSWAILAAKVCQLHPGATTYELVTKFFDTYSTWDWDSNTKMIGESVESGSHAKADTFPAIGATSTDLNGYVCLVPIEEYQNKVPRWVYMQNDLIKVKQMYKEWNPHNSVKDASNPMSIVTPIFPCHNTSYNVQFSHRVIIIDELRRGKTIIDSFQRHRSNTQLMDYTVIKVEENKRTRRMVPNGGREENTDISEIKYDELYDCLCRPAIISGPHLLRISVSAENGQLYNSFYGLVKSRMRILVRLLESCEGLRIRPHNDQCVIILEPALDEHNVENSLSHLRVRLAEECSKFASHINSALRKDDGLRDSVTKLKMGVEVIKC